MPTAGKQTPQKTACINPNTGNSILVDTDIYKLFQKAIYHTLQSTPGIPFSGIISGIKKFFNRIM
jgi:hypothetical protein